MSRFQPNLQASTVLLRVVNLLKNSNSGTAYSHAAAGLASLIKLSKNGWCGQAERAERRRRRTEKREREFSAALHSSTPVQPREVKVCGSKGPKMSEGQAADKEKELLQGAEGSEPSHPCGTERRAFTRSSAKSGCDGTSPVNANFVLTWACLPPREASCPFFFLFLVENPRTRPFPWL